MSIEHETDSDVVRYAGCRNGPRARTGVLAAPSSPATADIGRSRADRGAGTVGNPDRREPGQSGARTVGTPDRQARARGFGALTIGALTIRALPAAGRTVLS